MAANGITSIVSEPIFYGPVAPSSLDAKSSDCAVPAEEFLQLMSAARDRFHVGDDTAAISRAVGNLRGVAASWYRSRTKCPPAGTDPTALQTDWDVFVATFRSKWFRQRTRWDTSTSYLEIRQKPNEPTWVLLERIIDEYLADQELVRDATNLRLAGQDPSGTPADIGRLEALPQADQDAVGRIMSNARKDSVALCLETMRDADIACAFVLACADDRLRKAVRRKAATGLNYSQLEAFIRTEDDTLKASKPRRVLPFVLCSRLNSPLILGSQAAQQLRLRHDGRTNLVSAPPQPLHHPKNNAKTPPPSVASLSVVSKVDISPLSAWLVPLSLAADSPLPSASFVASLQGVPVVATTDSFARCSLYISNPSPSTLSLPRGAVLALAEPLSSYPARPRESDVLARAAADCRPRPITPAVRAAILDAVKHLPSPRREPLLSLLTEFQDIFS
jgi:hypothetical protein